MALLHIASMQYRTCIQGPETMPAAKALWNVLHAFGLICTATFWVLFIAGFVFAEWWVPLVGLFGGMVLSEIIPQRMRQPGLVYLSTLIAMPFVVITVSAM